MNSVIVTILTRDYVNYVKKKKNKLNNSNTQTIYGCVDMVGMH